MPRALRRFFVWLLIVILPVQAYAAASMVACGPRHERMAAAMAASAHAGMRSDGSDAGAHDHRAHDHRAHHHPDHEHAGPASHGHDAAPADDAVSVSSDSAGITCSACAACCVGAALPVGDVALHSPAPVPGTLRPAMAAPFDAVTLDGLERPPRSFLA